MLQPARKLRRVTFLLAALCALACLPAARVCAATSPNNNCAEAEKLSEEAVRLRAEWKLDALRAAIEKYEAARACWQAAGEKTHEGDALKEMGDVYFVLSDYPKARESYEEAVRLREATGERQKEAEALNNLGLVYISLGDLKKTSEYSGKALNLSRETGAKGIEARALNSIGFMYYMQGDLPHALDNLTQARALAERLDDHLPLAEILLNIGYTRNDIGELEEALKFFQQAVPLWQEAHQQRGLSRTLTAIGGVFNALGESQQALAHHRQALQIAEEIGDPEGQAIIHNGLGYSYESLGDNERALDFYLQALENFRRASNLAGEAQSSQFVGKIYRKLGQNEQAQIYYQKCLDISRSPSMNDRMLEALALNSIGLSEQAMGKTKDALDNFNQAFAIYRGTGSRRAEAITLNNLGDLFKSQGEKSKAVSHYLRALPLAQGTGDRALEVLTRGHVAELERDAGRYQEARSQLEASLKIIETLRANVVSTDLRSSYMASVREHYELYIDVLMQMHKEHPADELDVAALKVSEQARARSLLDLLTEAHANIRQGISPALLEQEQSLQSKLDKLAAQQMQMRGSQHSAEQAAALDKEIRDLNGEYEQLETRIREQSPRYAALTQPQSLDVDEVRRRVLDDKTLLLEYVLGHERSYLWVIGNTEVSSYELPSGAQIEESARRLYELLLAYQPVQGETTAQQEARQAQTDGQYWSQAAALSKLILEPAARQLADKRLLVVADGALQYIPFGALTIPEQGSQNAETANSVADPKPLMLEHEIVSLPSINTLAVVRREVENRQPSPKAVAVFADPVFEREDPRLRKTAGADASGDAPPQAAELQQALRDIDPTQGKSIPRLLNSRAEAEKIMSLVPSGVGFKALGFEATRTQAMNLDLGQYQIVHFATHGILNSKHPELSGVVLSLMDETGSPQNGFLRLRDIYNLNLPVELVVLSACNTGLGKDVRGEGLVGLTRGFMYAGASSVMASLWKVDDAATSELMGRFYQELLKDGRTPAAALRAAQAGMWKQKRWRAPYFWAGFVLQGEYSRNIRVKADEHNKYRAPIIAGALLLGLAAAGLYVFKRARKGTRVARVA